MNDDLFQALEQFYKAQGPPKKPTVYHAKHCNAWPMPPSEALGVHKSQVQEAVASAKKHGVPTEFTPDGRPIFRDRGHRRKYLKAYGFHDNRGGYGDG